jgi:2-oxoisovalerate dehydrogenase E2 component (dihydrolipoyl transacylase)
MILTRRSVNDNSEGLFCCLDIGEGIAEVELMQWFVAEGDTLNQFDNVCEVQSDKATVEISSRYDGVVTKVHHAVGDMVQVGSALVDIEVDAEEEGGGEELASSGGDDASSALSPKSVEDGPVTSAPAAATGAPAKEVWD